jgi:hypothetical protein
VYIDKPILQIVERRGHNKPEKWSNEIKQAVSTLQSHPGFIAVLDRIALQREMLEHKNNTQFKKDLREADFIQAGIIWLGYLQQLVDSAVALPQASYRSAYDEELEAHRQLDAQIERVGMD